MTFDPAQPRDENGRWTDGGSGGSGISLPTSAEEAKSLEEHPHWNPNGLSGKYASNQAYDKNKKTLLKKYENDAKEFKKKIASDPEAKAAVMAYTGKDFAAFREADRGDPRGLVNSETKKKVEKINSLFTAENMKESVLFRGMAMSDESFSKMLSSGTVKTDAMTSMTANPDVAKFFSGSFNNTDPTKNAMQVTGADISAKGAVQARVILRVKDKALPIGKVSFDTGQDEMLVPKGRTYRISRVTRIADSDFDTEKVKLMGHAKGQTYVVDLD